MNKVEEHSSEVERGARNMPRVQAEKRKYSEMWRIDLETPTDRYLRGILKEEKGGKDSQAIFKEVIAETSSELKTSDQKYIWVPSMEIRINPYLNRW